MSNVFYLVGPTAVGKTGLAVELAERVGAEVVSADAFQVYEGFDLLTAKPTPEQRHRVRHHLVGCVPLAESHSVARFLQQARARIDDIVSRGKPALVVGGNGLYVKALTHGLAELPEAQPALRAELEALPAAELWERLRTLDPATAAVIDGKNSRRVIRAVEVCLITGKPFSASRTEWNNRQSSGETVGIFLVRKRAELIERIDRRVDQMFAEGVLEEVRNLTGASLSPTSERIIGLADLRACLAGEIDPEVCRERIKLATRRYAKRQATWFKREMCFQPLLLSAAESAEHQMAQVLSHMLVHAGLASHLP